MATFLLQSRNKEFRTYIHLCIQSYICIFVCVYICVWFSPGGTGGGSLSANAGHVRDAGWVHGQGDLQEMTASSILAWTGRSRLLEGLVGYSAWGCEESDMTGGD